MIYLFVSLLFVLGTTAQTPDELKCDLPPPTIPNGKAELINYELVKGQIVHVHGGSYNESLTKVSDYNMRVTCDPGFTISGRGSILSYCSDGKIPEIPDCVARETCRKSLDDPNLLSCGIGFDYTESMCVIPSEGIVGFGAALTAPTCGRLASGSLVVNGAPAKHGEVPWHVGIYTKNTRPYMQVCGGTLVRNNVVISAAHCFWSDIEKKLPAENFAVAAGKIYRPWNNANDTDYATKSDVREIRIPPRYRGGATNFQDDLAVLLLTTPLQVDNVNVVLACLDFDNTLDEKQLQDGQIGTVAGWGLISADGPASQILNVVKLPIVDIDRCINGAEPSFLSSITSDKICAGYTNGTTVCRGDSGGGIAIPENDNEGDKYFLRGIVSTAPKSDHLCNVYAVATFTQVAKHRHFINAAMSGAPETPAAAPMSPSIAIIDQPAPASVPLTNPLNTSGNNAVNANGNINLNDTVSDTRPIQLNDGVSMILPITKAPNGVEESTVPNEKPIPLSCKDFHNTSIRLCYNTNSSKKKCKGSNKIINILTGCDEGA